MMVLSENGAYCIFISKDYDNISPYFPIFPRIFRQTRINEEVPAWSHGTNEAGSIMSLSGLAKIWEMHDRPTLAMKQKCKS